MQLVCVFGNVKFMCTNFALKPPPHPKKKSMWRALRQLQLRSLSLRLSEYIAKKRVDAPAPDSVTYADFLFVPSKSSAPQECSQNGWLYCCATDSFALKFAIMALFRPIHSFFYFLYFFLPYRKKLIFVKRKNGEEKSANMQRVA